MQNTKHRIKKAKVVKISGKNTISVLVETLKRHEKYHKVIQKSKKYLVHTTDESKYNVGDKVSIIECRPISKLKAWRIYNKEEREEK